MQYGSPDDLAGLRQLPGTERLLISGGDARIGLDPASGLNKYGCQPLPDSGLLSFGSSTASTISQAGFVAADQLRERIQCETVAESIVYGREMQRIRMALLSDVSDLDVELVFANRVPTRTSLQRNVPRAGRRSQ